MHFDPHTSSLAGQSRAEIEHGCRIPPGTSAVPHMQMLRGLHTYNSELNNHWGCEEWGMNTGVSKPRIERGKRKRESDSLRASALPTAHHTQDKHGDIKVKANFVMVEGGLFPLVADTGSVHDVSTSVRVSRYVL